MSLVPLLVCLFLGGINIMLRLFEAVYVYLYLSIENALCYAVHFGGEFQEMHPKIFEALIWTIAIIFMGVVGEMDRQDAIRGVLR